MKILLVLFALSLSHGVLTAPGDPCAGHGSKYRVVIPDPCLKKSANIYEGG